MSCQRGESDIQQEAKRKGDISTTLVPPFFVIDFQ